jgi:diguanylate cyclase (GGDEF)-like protein
LASADKAQRNRPQQERDLEGALAVLSSLGEVAYRWALDEDRLEWDGDVQSVLGVDPRGIASGRDYDALVEPNDGECRRDVILSAGAADRGSGVPYRAEYALRPGGPDHPSLWIEDCGRWYGDGSPSPRRAVGIIRVVSDRQEHQRRQNFRSSHDELTGFYNRTRLLELLGEALEQAEHFHSSSAFLLISIDRFRLINDRYGFEVGDKVLAAIAKRVASRLRAGDAIGRFSGNKLGVILDDCSDATIAVAAQRFLDVAREAVVTTENGAIAVTISIGGVTLPRNAHSISEATAHAEEALFRSRRHGHGRFQPYVRSHSQAAERLVNAVVSTEMIQALGDNRICLAFQPIVDASSREPALYECLLRLERPDGTIVEAQSFLPQSERLGLSRLLDRRALELALNTLVARTDVLLSVNVTADSATEPSWLAFLRGAVAHRPDIARRLVVEITESAAVKNVDEAARFVGAVKSLGCRVALDDFGAGYSSFRILRRLDIDFVKIDGGFIRNLADNDDDKIFVRTLLTLARHHGLKTVAEWVRDDESAALLWQWGVDYLQGDLAGAPLLYLAEPGALRGRQTA